MVKIVESIHYNRDVVSLWQEAFGDSKEDVLFFIDNCKNKSVLMLFDNEELAAMLFLVDAKVNAVDYKYIYAACTFEKFRCMGYMSKLLDYATKKYVNALLIPADDELVKYYRKRNFRKIINVDDIEFNECSEIKEYLFEGCSLNEPIALAFVKGD